MFAAPALQGRRRHGNARDPPRASSKVKRQAGSPAAAISAGFPVTLPPLCPDPRPPSGAPASRSSSSPATILLRGVASDSPLLVGELPPLIARAGAGKATEDTKWTPTTQSFTGKDEPASVGARGSKRTKKGSDGRAAKVTGAPLTATEVVQTLVRRRGRGEFELYYLKEVESDAYRPYDLRVVQPAEAGPEHYVFSPDAVLHVTERGGGGLVGLAEWYRESALWAALQGIRFFREFRTLKSFTWWHRTAREIVFRRRCEDLQGLLLTAVPQYRNALLLFSSIIEELKGTRLLPRDESSTYTWLDFKKGLTAQSQERLQMLRKLSRHRAVVLNVAKAESYRALQELQLHNEYARKPNGCCEPIHLHLAHQRELEEELARAEADLQKLGNFAALVDQMTLQSLVTVARQDAAAVLSRVLQGEGSRTGCLFQAELRFSSGGQLALEPPLRLFQETLSEALATAGDSMCQMCDACGFFLEVNNSCSQDLTSDLARAAHTAMTGANKDTDGRTGDGTLCCCRRVSDQTARRAAPREPASVRVEGSRAAGCYRPLSRQQLMWHSGINDASKQAEEQQTELMQEAHLEVQQLCDDHKWLEDVRLFLDEWGPASLECLKGQPASQYEELIKKMRLWTESIRTLPSSISTSKQLFVIHCTHMKENLEQHLVVVEEQVWEQLADQMKLHSEELVSDLEGAISDLRSECQELHHFSKYTAAVRESVRTAAASRERLEYVRSLQDCIRSGRRKMTGEELTLDRKMLGLWDCFAARLKEAESIVCQRLPPMADALDTMFPFLVSDLRNTVSMATSGPFLDSVSDADEMVGKLTYMCAKVRNVRANLEQLRWNNETLQEKPKDLTFLTADVHQIEARRELWELIALYRRWMPEWEGSLFGEVAVSEAQEKIAKWQRQVSNLSSIIPAQDALLQEFLEILENLSQKFAVLTKLQGPTLKQKHQRAVFQGMGLQCVSEGSVTLAELMSQQLEVHQKLINKICGDAKIERSMEESFQKIQQGWRTRLLQVDRLIVPVWQRCEHQHGLTESPTAGAASNPHAACQNIVVGLEIHLAEIDHDLMTLSGMRNSPHSADFRSQVEDWTRRLQELEKLLDLFERYQQKWAFLTKMFHGTSIIRVQRVDLLERFRPVDETFKSLMHSISARPNALNLVRSDTANDSFHGDRLCHTLVNGLSIMEAIFRQMVDVMDSLCELFPRLWFLGDREVIELLSFHPTPSTLLSFVRRFFKGVHWLKVDSGKASDAGELKAACDSSKEMKVLGIVGSLRENITFLSPLEPNQNLLVWLSDFEKQLKLTMEQLVKQCAHVRNHLERSNQDSPCDMKAGDRQICGGGENAPHMLDLLSKYPLQCILVAQEALWHGVVLQAFKESSPAKLSNIKADNCATLRKLGQSIRDRFTGSESDSPASKYRTMCLRALVQLTMKHGEQLSRLMEVQCEPKSSFEWLSLVKYCIASQDPSLSATDNSTCYVDVLGHRLQYGYEYFGPEDWLMVHTPSTDRGALGILLALTSYKCGFVGGPCTSGKKKTAVQFGKALGRQVVVLECRPGMSADVAHRMLLGALRTGAWLLLDSVDSLNGGVQSSLAQRLEDIHQAFSELARKRKPSADGCTGCKSISAPECHMVFGGKRISASPNYGCLLISSKPYASGVSRSLRSSARPVALTRPDYRIIAEVTLTSAGFTEAAPLSRRLVSLMGLAEDARCLPDLITEHHSGCLVVLQRIITSSEIHLQRSVKQREISDKAKGSAAESPQWTYLQNVSAGVVDRVGEETEKQSSHRSVIQGLMEEMALVKGILSVLSPVVYVSNKAAQFNAILKDAFPTACQFPPFQQCLEEEEEKQLNEAVTEELERNLFQPDAEVINSILTLYQTMKLPHAVMLVGASGSGKTTCYSTLAGALNSLSAQAVDGVFENDNVINREGPQARPRTSALPWSRVDTVVLFPNAMSHDEVFGCFCDERGWRDGAVAKVLRDSRRLERASFETRKNIARRAPAAKWLVMDGEPAGQPGWLDYISTLSNPEHPFLCLLSGEILVPSQSHLKLLMETTDLSDASPSAVTRCSLVYFAGTDLWKAVWKSEVDSLHGEHGLDRGTLKMWKLLAEDLFPSTLSLLKTSSTDQEESCKSSTFGLIEVASCGRILRALLQHFGTDVAKAGEATETRGATTKELFLLAYIWGFGGHLHPRHWPRFDAVARQALFNCRHKIVVPIEETVFGHFFGIGSKINPRNPLLTNPVAPEYRKYVCLLNLMLEAKQPVLLAGEPSSGKTTLCDTLLSVDKPHIRLPADSPLSSGVLRTILNTVSCQQTSKDTADFSPKKAGLLLFVDDLHEAPCDVFGKMSTALETLRQSISKGGILHFDTFRFKSPSPGTISYMATCCVSALDDHHAKVISPRLSRLFSVFVLPGLTTDMTVSIHSPPLERWLKDMPFIQSVTDMARCIISATKSLYHAVCNKFQPATIRSPCVRFSHHDLQKVFQGMCLWQPDALPGSRPAPQEPAATALDVVQLWMHECVRTFSDRLCSEDDRKAVRSLIAKEATARYGIRLLEGAHADSLNSPPAPASLTVHARFTDAAGACQTLGRVPNALNLAPEPEPSGQPDQREGVILTEPSAPPDSDNFEEASLKTHPVQEQALQHMGGTLHELEYGPDLSEVLNSTSRHPKCSSSYQERDPAVLVQQVSTIMDRKEKTGDQESDKAHNIASKCVVQKQRVRQLLHILRALAVPGGHGVLIGSERGTGRKTTVRLAAHVAGCQLMEIHPGNEREVHRILEEAGNRTRAGRAKVMILVHERIGSSVRDELLVAMAHRRRPGLNTEEELRGLVAKATAVKNSRRYQVDGWTFETRLRQIHRNVHVFLLMPFNVSDDSETPAKNGSHQCRVDNAQMAKALRLSCCVEVYHPWSHGSLVEVATLCLKNMKREGLQDALPVAMAGIHQSARRYASVLLSAQPFSPQTYLEFIAHFSFLRKHLHEQGRGQANRLATVLSRLDVMNSAAAMCKQDLIRQQEEVAETQQREKELLQAVNNQRNLLQEAQQRCVEVESKLDQLEGQISRSQGEVMTVFQSSLKILECLNPSDLEEVRSYRDPPDGVVKIMDAVCLLFNRPSGWESAKQLLGQPNFFQELEFFDRFSLSSEQLQQLGQIVGSPLFRPESARELSRACESLCRWVAAVHECCRMRRHLLVRQQLEVLAGEAQGQVQLAKRRRAEAQRRLGDAELQLRVLRKSLEEQLLQLHKAEGLERRAAAAARQLESHDRDWRAAAQEVELNIKNAPGDALILAAIISYLGPFAPDVRSELLSKWEVLCKTGGININPTDPRASLFKTTDAAPPHAASGFPIAASGGRQPPVGRALGLDSSPARPVVQLLLRGCRRAWVQRWLLLADAQHHLEISSLNQLVTGDTSSLERDLECGMVLWADDPNLLDKLDQAAERGLRVLVTHVERAVDSPRLLARLARPSRCCLPGLKQDFELIHPEFCLFLSTHLPVRLLNSYVRPSILERVRVVDLSPSSEEIQELMLTRFLRSECKELLVQRLHLQRERQRLQRRLITEEDALMHHILQSSSTPQESDFLPHAAARQEAMTKLPAEMERLREALEHHESLLAAPRQLMKLAAALYQALQEVSRLSPAYHFSLSGFVTVMRGALVVRGRPFVSGTAGRLAAGVIPEMTHRMAARLLGQYRPCLFKSHAAALKLLVSLALLRHDRLCSAAERAAFLMGLQDAQIPAARETPRPSPPTWISPELHPELLRLEQIPAFRGLIGSLAASPAQWKEYLRSPSSTVAGAVPCRSHSHLSLLQRALLWKTLLPQCLGGLAEAMAACRLCLPEHTAAAEAPHSQNLQALLARVVKHEGPIILTVPSPGKHACTGLQPLHLIKQMAACAADPKEVKVIFFGDRREREFTLSTLEKAVNDGHWLVFDNCHLLDRWDDEVAALLGCLISSFGDPHSCSAAESHTHTRIHPGFRLWFISEEGALPSIPAALRMRALPLVCDCARDVREELSRSLLQVASVTRRPSPPGIAPGSAALLLRCAAFHSVLLQRQAYKYSGQGRIYCWSQADLQALVDAFVRIGSVCSDQTEALLYIAVNLAHGGHVLESADRQLVESVAGTCLGTAPPLCDGGPHILSNAVSGGDRFDFSELPALEKRLLDSASTGDPLVLGFGPDAVAEISEVESLNLSALLRDSQTQLGLTRCCSGEKKKKKQQQQQLATALPDASHAQARLQALHRRLTRKTEGALTDAGAAARGALRDFLLAERGHLIDLVSSRLSRLFRRSGTPTSASCLGPAELSRLERRAELLAAYLGSSRASDPRVYSISAFGNARGLLVAAMREAARANGRRVGDIALHFEVVNDCTGPASPPLNVVYLCGLELRGASWDAEMGALQHALSPEPCAVPLLRVTAQVEKRDASLLSGGSARAEVEVYHCPLYLEDEQDAGNWAGLTHRNLITTVPLHTKLNPLLCSLRGVRLVSRLCVSP